MEKSHTRFFDED